MRWIYTLVFCCFFGLTPPLSAQIYLKNPSFEGVAKDATMPVEWSACELGSTPDILPGFWDVWTKPAEGNTYLGLITREDGSRESIGQRLSESLVAGECYTFSLQLAQSRTYANYNLPIRIRIWGGSKTCDKTQLIGETTVITHQEWQTYAFDFFTKNTISYIMLEATYAKGISFVYRGNILVDACSSIKQCPRASL